MKKQNESESDARNKRGRIIVRKGNQATAEGRTRWQRLCQFFGLLSILNTKCIQILHQEDNCRSELTYEPHKQQEHNKNNKGGCP